MLQRPSFTVIVSLYNKLPYVRSCVESVLAQSYHDFELLVVDDGSTDGGIDAIADIADRRLRIIRQQNMGGAGGQARNTGMANAKGDWFAFLDGDDAWLPSHLMELDRIRTRFPNAGLISPGCVEVPYGTVLDGQIGPTSSPRVRTVDYFVEAARCIGVNNASSTAIPRRVFEHLGGFANYRSGPDLEYWARIALHYPVAFSDRVTSVYFRNTNGNMEQIARERPRELPRVTNLRDVSPSVRLLHDLAESDPLKWEDPSIRSYVNSRVANGIRVSLSQRNFVRARDFAGLLLEPLTPQQRAMRIGVRLPAPILNATLGGYRALKRGRGAASQWRTESANSGGRPR